MADLAAAAQHAAAIFAAANSAAHFCTSWTLTERHDEPPVITCVHHIEIEIGVAS